MRSNEQAFAQSFCHEMLASLGYLACLDNCCPQLRGKEAQTTHNRLRASRPRP